VEETDIIAKRRLEIKVISAQLEGVEKKLENLTKTRDGLRLGLRRAEDSLKNHLEIKKGK